MVWLNFTEIPTEMSGQALEVGTNQLEISELFDQESRGISRFQFSQGSHRIHSKSKPDESINGNISSHSIWFATWVEKFLPLCIGHPNRTFWLTNAGKHNAIHCYFLMSSRFSFTVIIFSAQNPYVAFFKTLLCKTLSKVLFLLQNSYNLLHKQSTISLLMNYKSS